MRSSVVLGFALAVALVGGGCSSEPAPTKADAGGYVPTCKSIGAANEVSADDPRAPGQCAFLLDAWGTEALDDWPTTEFMLDLLTKEKGFFGEQFTKFGFLEDPNDDLPIGLKRGLVDPSKIRETCAACHVAKLPDGRLWLGAPNTKLLYAPFRVAVNQRWVAAGHAPLFDSMYEQKLLKLGPGRIGAESSDYPDVVPADFPPYFTLAQRKNLNYLGTGRNLRTEVYFSIYSSGAGSPNDKTAKVPFPSDQRVDEFLTFFGAMESPIGPAQDAELVKAGKLVFEFTLCGSCHHVNDLSADKVTTHDKTPDAKEHLPDEDPMFPRGSIRTDGLHRILIDGAPTDADAGAGDGGTGPDTGYQDLLAFIEKHGLAALPTDGYRPSDLHGLWATAPYLHNGSVPTLEDLLKPAVLRPGVWSRDGFFIDTKTPGNSNSGHEFGTDISDTDKIALAAYLRSL